MSEKINSRCVEYFTASDSYIMSSAALGELCQVWEANPDDVIRDISSWRLHIYNKSIFKCYKLGTWSVNDMGVYWSWRVKLKAAVKWHYGKCRMKHLWSLIHSVQVIEVTLTASILTIHFLIRLLWALWVQNPFKADRDNHHIWCYCLQINCRTANSALVICQKALNVSFNMAGVFIHFLHSLTVSHHCGVFFTLEGSYIIIFKMLMLNYY